MSKYEEEQKMVFKRVVGFGTGAWIYKVSLIDTFCFQGPYIINPTNLEKHLFELVEAGCLEKSKDIGGVKYRLTTLI